MADGGDATRLAPFNPTGKASIAAAMELLKLEKEDSLLDVGCGDGRLLIQAAKDVKCVCRGIERDERLVEKANAAIREAKVDDLVKVELADAMEADWGSPTAVFLYLVPEGLKLVREKVEALLQHDVRIATNMFSLPDLTPTKEIPVGVVKVRLYTKESLPKP